LTRYSKYQNRTFLWISFDVLEVAIDSQGFDDDLKRVSIEPKIINGDALNIKVEPFGSDFDVIGATEHPGRFNVDVQRVNIE